MSLFSALYPILAFALHAVLFHWWMPASMRRSLIMAAFADFLLPVLFLPLSWLFVLAVDRWGSGISGNALFAAVVLCVAVIWLIRACIAALLARKFWQFSFWKVLGVLVLGDVMVLLVSLFFMYFARTEPPVGE